MSLSKPIRLTRYQKERLESIRSTTKDVRVRRRATVILLSIQGYPTQAIADATGYKEQGVYHMRRQWRKYQFSSLQDKPRPGTPPKINDTYLELLKDTVRTPPGHLGYIFTTWSLGRLSAHLKKLTGIDISIYQLSRILRQIGYSYKHPKHTTRNKQNLRAYRSAQRQLKVLKKGRVVKMPPMNYGSMMRPVSLSCPI